MTGGSTGGFLSFISGLGNLILPSFSKKIKSKPAIVRIPEKVVVTSGTGRRARDDEKIVGGTEAAGDFPFFASVLIHYKDDMYAVCGGSIVAPNWVITAAHW
jgi:hypothetical protein